MEEELRPGYLPGGLLDPAPQLGLDLGEQGVYLLFPFGGEGEGDLYLVSSHQGGEEPPALGQESALPQVQGGLGRRRGVWHHGGAGDGIGALDPRHGEGDAPALAQAGLLQAGLGLGLGEAAQVHPRRRGSGQGGRPAPAVGAQG